MTMESDYAHDRACDGIRHALPEEAEILTELALVSKAVWGYSDEFIAKCRRELTITCAFIEQNVIYVFVSEARIAGFYVLIPGEPTAVLDFLYVHPDFLHRGYGKRLWQHAMDQASQTGASQVSIDADPHAEPFYLAMGARRVGVVASGSIPGRVIPQMVYWLATND